MIDVELMEVMGDDWSAVEAARISYQKGTRPLNDDIRLLNYLMQHKHDSVFEMAQIKVRIKCPIYIARQIMRHRSFSFNEISARYSVLDEESYIPPRFSKQSLKNKQGSGDYVDCHTEWMAQGLYLATVREAFKNYQTLLDLGISREQARGILPCATITQFIMNGDLRAWLHFISLRIAKGAQSEVQDVARRGLEILRERFPETVKAFETHRLHRY
jgi:thymidylate synthase (FAD)